MICKMVRLIAAGCILLISLGSPVAAQNAIVNGKAEGIKPIPDPVLQELVNEAARATLAKYKDKKLEESNLAITLIDLSNPQRPTQASFRGAEPIYPASV
ncbi:MAG: hypothetical protein H0U54_05440, partial [Acidobacteria bacterium]|nr:hypothetical protein [Acidobacteriota bacterium]